MNLRQLSTGALWLVALSTLVAILLISDSRVSEQIYEENWDLYEDGYWSFFYYFQAFLIACLGVRTLAPEFGILVLPFLVMWGVWVAALFLIYAFHANWYPWVWIQGASVIQAGIISILLYRLPKESELQPRS